MLEFVSLLVIRFAGSIGRARGPVPLDYVRRWGFLDGENLILELREFTTASEQSRQQRLESSPFTILGVKTILKKRKSHSVSNHAGRVPRETLFGNHNDWIRDPDCGRWLNADGAHPQPTQALTLPK